MTYTSPTAINTSQGISSILNYISEVTNFWFSRMMLLGIFIIFLVGYLRSKSDDDLIAGLAVASYATLLISILFWIIGFVDGVTFGLVIGISIISTAMLLMDRRGTS